MNCDKKSCLLSIAAVFIFMFGFDFLVHGLLMAPLYEAHKALWRPEEEMQQFVPFCILYHALLAALFTCTFFCWVKKIAANAPAEVKKFALGYGVFIGVIMGAVASSLYILLPVSGAFALANFAASVVQGIGVGYVLLFLYQKKCAAK